METVNAVIRSTMLGIEDHGILTAMITLEFDGACQGFGGYALDEPVKNKKGDFVRRRGVAFGAEFILQVLNTVGVSKWEDLPGKNIRVVREEGINGLIVKIGHIVKDKWFAPKELAEEMLEAK